MKRLLFLGIALAASLSVPAFAQDFSGYEERYQRQEQLRQLQLQEQLLRQQLWEQQQQTRLLQQQSQTESTKEFIRKRQSGEIKIGPWEHFNAFSKDLKEWTEQERQREEQQRLIQEQQHLHQLLKEKIEAETRLIRLMEQRLKDEGYNRERP
jgi:hypothetical protein